MNTLESISALESRQLELLGVMRQSDAHALKCQKLGKVFADEYPEDFAAYEAARQEYNENEVALAELQEQRNAELEAEAAARENQEGE